MLVRILDQLLRPQNLDMWMGFSVKVDVPPLFAVTSSTDGRPRQQTTVSW